jgi:hypothetical protein
MSTRRKVFTKEFMETKFGEYHKTYMGIDAVTPGFGYPDGGAGPYARALPYKDWFMFNCA